MGLASALSTALTGMDASQTAIDVAGNNIANSNTVGFKQSTVSFANQFLQTNSLGTSPSGNSGGTNPSQTGLGTEVSEVTQDFSQGTLENTTDSHDLAIQGDGFFVVQGNDGGQLYTRNGEFTTNADNELVTSGGQLLLGQAVNNNFQIQSTSLAPLTIPLGSTSVAQATQNVDLEGTLPPSSGTNVAAPSIVQSQVLSDGALEVPANLGTAASNLYAVVPPTTTATTATLDTTTAGALSSGGTYQYEVTFTQANGDETPPSAVIGPVTTTGSGQSIDLDDLPIPTAAAGTPPITGINIYRTDASGTGTYYKVGSVAVSSSSTNVSYTDTASDATITDTTNPNYATLNTNTLAAGSYSYYVTFVNSATGQESRPTALIGPETLSDNGCDIELNGLPSPTTSDYDEIRIYRNTAANSNNFYAVTTLPAGTTSYVDSTPDASITSNKQIDLDGPGIGANTLLTNVIERSGSTYTNLFQTGATISFTGSVGGTALDTKSFQVTSTSTVADFENFVAQAFGIQTAQNDPTITGNPGVTVTSDGRLQITGNNGTANSLDITSSSFSETLPDGTVDPINLGFTTTQAATGESTSTDFVVYDSLGTSVDVNLTLQLESTSTSGTTYRWFATSGDNQPATGVGTAVGTGEVTFDGSGNLLSETNNVVSIDRDGSSAVSPLQFKLNFNSVSGLAAASPTISASSQDGSAPGTLSSYSVGSNGLITGTFSNGKSETLGQIVLAKFANDDGLTQDGQNMYSQGSNSGLPIIGTPGTQGIGTLVAGALEESNTDTSQNLIDLITDSTQYRSSAQVISTVQTLYDAP